MNGYFRISSLTGLLAVALGAFGAHALREPLAMTGPAEVWRTAVFYHLVHAVVMLGIARAGWSRPAWWCFAAGVLLFSGSLYALAASGTAELGVITPFGGMALLAGWLLLAVAKRWE